jgi:hypothetical protein
MLVAPLQMTLLIVSPIKRECGHKLEPIQLTSRFGSVACPTTRH